MFRKLSLIVMLMAILLVVVTSASSQTPGCNCANASLMGDTVGTRFVGGPVVNTVVNPGIELVNAGPVLIGAGQPPR